MESESERWREGERESESESESARAIKRCCRCQVSGYYTGLVASRFFKVFVGRNLDGFVSVAWTAVLTVLATAVIRSAKAFIAKLLSLYWRKNLVSALHRTYFRVRFCWGKSGLRARRRG